VQDAAMRMQATPEQVLFCWLIQAGHQPLTGTKSRKHMLQDLQAATMRISDDDFAKIGSLF